MVRFSPAYPTPEHELAARRIAGFFARQAHVSAVLLTCSCARGKASRDSCLDMCILVSPDVTATQRHELEQAWSAYHESEDAFKALLKVGRYSQVDLEFSDGRLAPHDHGWTSGPDEFELEIGNIVAYSVTLWEEGGYLKQLQARWLPFYDEATRRERLAMVMRYCRNNLDHIPLYVELAERTHMVAGHPVIAGPEGDELFIQVTKVGHSPDRWHVSVNNPTDRAITTTPRAEMPLPGLELPAEPVTLQPGEYRVLM